MGSKIGIGPAGGGLVSIPVIVKVILVKALYKAFGRTDAAAVGVGPAAARSVIKFVTANANVAGSIKATAVAATPFVPGGGGAIVAPADITSVLAIVACCHACAIFAAGVIGSGEGIFETKANKFWNMLFCHVNCGGGETLAMLLFKSSLLVTFVSRKLAMFFGASLPVESGGNSAKSANQVGNGSIIKFPPF